MSSENFFNLVFYWVLVESSRDRYQNCVLPVRRSFSGKWFVLRRNRFSWCFSDCGQKNFETFDNCSSAGFSNLQANYPDQLLAPVGCKTKNSISSWLHEEQGSKLLKNFTESSKKSRGPKSKPCPQNVFFSKPINCRPLKFGTQELKSKGKGTYLVGFEVISPAQPPLVLISMRIQGQSAFIKIMRNTIVTSWHLWPSLLFLKPNFRQWYLDCV